MPVVHYSYMTINNKLQHHILLACLSHEYSWPSTCTIIIPTSLNQHALQVQFVPIISQKLHNNIQTPTIFIPSYYAIDVNHIILNAVINVIEALCLIDSTCVHTILTTVYHTHYYNYAATGDVVQCTHIDDLHRTQFSTMQLLRAWSSFSKLFSS